MKIVVATPTRGRLHPLFVDGLAQAAEHLRGLGHTLDCVEPVVANIYIDQARNTLTHRVLKTDADVVVFLDDDVIASPQDWERLVTSPFDFVCGAYRYKLDEEDYPVVFEVDELGYALVSSGTGCISLAGAPAGFVAIKMPALRSFAEHYSETRAYIEPDRKSKTGAFDRIIDLWPAGLDRGRWFGEDYGFCNLWRGMERRIWCDPRLKPSHWAFTSDTDGIEFKADIDAWMRRLPPAGQEDAEAEAA